MILLALTLFMVIMFGTVQATNSVSEKKVSTPLKSDEKKVKNADTAPVPARMRRVPTPAPKNETPAPAEQPVIEVKKDENDKRDLLTGYWQMEKTNLGLWISYQFTGGEDNIVFDYAGPMGYWESGYELLSYDGTTVKAGNPEKNEEAVSFTAKFSDKKLVVSGIGTTNDTTHLRHFNGTYVLEEDE